MKRILLLMLLIAGVLADGGYFPPPYHQQMYEPTQEAMLVFDGSHETLIIKPSFDGDASSFAWVVPVPNYPTVEAADPELFYELYRLTQPVYESRATLGMGIMAASAPQGDVGIYLHERKQVGIYDTVVMSGWNAENFMWWFQKEGFAIPDSAMPLIEEYMAKDWIFVVMKINGSDYTGGIEPVKFEFDSPEAVYPLRISSVNKGASEIHLYVFADERQQEPGFNVTYASRFTADEARSYPKLNELLDREYFLTKLERTMWPTQMTYDIVVEDDVKRDTWTGAQYSEEYVPKYERPFDWGALIIVNIIAVPLLAVASVAFWFALNHLSKKKKLGFARALAYGLIALVLLNLALFSSQLGEIVATLVMLPIYLISGLGNWIGNLVPLLIVGVLIVLALAGIGVAFYAIHWVASKILKD